MYTLRLHHIHPCGRKGLAGAAPFLEPRRRWLAEVRPPLPPLHSTLVPPVDPAGLPEVFHVVSPALRASDFCAISRSADVGHCREWAAQTLALFCNEPSSCASSFLHVQMLHMAGKGTVLSQRISRPFGLPNTTLTLRFAARDAITSETTVFGAGATDPPLGGSSSVRGLSHRLSPFRAWRTQRVVES